MEPTGMESSKTYCSIRCRNSTYHCGAGNYSVLGGQYRDENGNIRNFGPTNPHGTAFALKQWVYQKEATGMKSSKMYCSSQCSNSAYQCGYENYSISWRAG